MSTFFLFYSISVSLEWDGPSDQVVLSDYLHAGILCMILSLSVTLKCKLLNDLTVSQINARLGNRGFTLAWLFQLKCWKCLQDNGSNTSSNDKCVWILSCPNYPAPKGFNIYINKGTLNLWISIMITVHWGGIFSCLRILNISPVYMFMSKQWEKGGNQGMWGRLKKTV